MSPLQRNEKISQYGQDYDRLAEAVRGLSKEALNYKPAPDKWSAHEIIVHIADAEANSYTRVRRALAEPGELVTAYDQDKWAAGLNYAGQDFALHLQLFKLLRQANYELIKDLTDIQWKNQYHHSEYGLVDLETWLDIYVKHVPGHIGQIQRNIQAMQ